MIHRMGNWGVPAGSLAAAIVLSIAAGPAFHAHARRAGSSTAPDCPCDLVLESFRAVEKSTTWVIANPPANSQGSMSLKGTGEWMGKGTDGHLSIDLAFSFKGQGSVQGGSYPGINIDISPLLNCDTEDSTSTEFPKKSFSAKDMAISLSQAFPASNFPNNLNPDPNFIIFATAKFDGDVHGMVNGAQTLCTKTLQKEKTITFDRTLTNGESHTRWNVKAK